MMMGPDLEVQRSGLPSPSLQPGVELEDVRRDESHRLGRLRDRFLFEEVRRAVEQVLGVKVSNGNGG